MPSAPLHDRRDWGGERINQCAWKGDNKEREEEVALEPFSLQRMLVEEFGSICKRFVSPQMGVLFFL